MYSMQTGCIGRCPMLRAYSVLFIPCIFALGEREEFINIGQASRLVHADPSALGELIEFNMLYLDQSVILLDLFFFVIG